jgi:3-oxoacyl-[acyl-carrier protein] reductase
VTAARFAGRVAVVTGGSRGIGRAVATRLGLEGACVVVSYLQAAGEAASAVEEIVAKGGQAIAVQADVTDETAVRQMVRAAVRRFGRLDLLVANAGVVRDQLLGAMTLDQWEVVVATNLRGPFLCIREALPFMMGTGSGNVVCLTSIAADRAGRGHANYVASKGGVNALVRSLAVELAPKRIRVNAVSPGVIRTDMTRRVRDLAEGELLSQVPLRRFGSPEEVAAAVCFLASDDASYITGEVLHVTGGFGL